MNFSRAHFLIESIISVSWQPQLHSIKQLQFLVAGQWDVFSTYTLKLGEC